MSEKNDLVQMMAITANGSLVDPAGKSVRVLETYIALLELAGVK